jgi:glutathione synthase/RimK-type ligase-like ATP-grasp enzyme
MLTVWLIAYNFDDPNFEIEQHYQYHTMINAFKKLGCNVKYIIIGDMIIKEHSKFIGYQNELLDAPDIAMVTSFISKGADDWKNKFRKLKQLGTVILNDSDNLIDYTDKVKMYNKYIEAGVRIPKTISLPYNEGKYDNKYTQIIGDKIGWPCVIKPNYGWSSMGVSVCHTPIDVMNSMQSIQPTMNDIMRKFSKLAPKVTHIIVQELIEADYMIAYTTCGIDLIYPTLSHGQANWLSKTTYKNHKLKEKYENHNLLLPYDPPPEARKLMQDSILALGLDFVRGELFATKDGFIVCEVNGGASFGMPSLAWRTHIANSMAQHAIYLYHQRSKKLAHEGDIIHA